MMFVVSLLMWAVGTDFSAAVSHIRGVILFVGPFRVQELTGSTHGSVSAVFTPRLILRFVFISEVAYVMCR